MGFLGPRRRRHIVRAEGWRVEADGEQVGWELANGAQVGSCFKALNASPRAAKSPSGPWGFCEEMRGEKNGLKGKTMKHIKNKKSTKWKPVIWETVGPKLTLSSYTCLVSTLPQRQREREHSKFRHITLTGMGYFFSLSSFMVTACHLQITTYIILPSRSRPTRVRIIGYRAIIILSRPSRLYRLPSVLHLPSFIFSSSFFFFFFNFQALKTHIEEKSTKWILDKNETLPDAFDLQQNYWSTISAPL